MKNTQIRWIHYLTFGGVVVARRRRTRGGIPPPLAINLWFWKFSFDKAMIAIPAIDWSFSDFNINISTMMWIPIISAMCRCCKMASPAKDQSALAPMRKVKITNITVLSYTRVPNVCNVILVTISLPIWNNNSSIAFAHLNIFVKSRL